MHTKWSDTVSYTHLDVYKRQFQTSLNSVPPLPTTQFYCTDQGSCDPRLMSLSMYNIQEEEHLRSATKLPLGLTIQPFATLIPDDVEIPIIGSTSMDSGEEIKPPLRCRRCRAYVNPKFNFTYDSNVICNICKIKMQVNPEDASMSMNGTNGEVSSQLELTKGCVDFLAPAVYNVNAKKPSLPLHYVFVIDVSLMANENGSSFAAIEGVRSSIEYISEHQPNCKVAIITYDKNIRFYSLRSESAQEFVVSEIDDVFLPFHDGLFVKPSESMFIINDTLERISNFIRNAKYFHVPETCYGSALQAAKLAIDTVTEGQGGKIVCSLNSLPNVGNGNLSLRKDDATKRHLKCDNEFYSKLAKSFVASYISLDLYVTSGGFVDMISVAHPVEMTNGLLKYYPHFKPDLQSATFINDMVQNISNIVGYQAILKVRCSAGLSVDQYYSASVDYSDRDPVIPVLTKDTTLDVLFKYDEKLKTGEDMHFQTALLYTDHNGVRKVRSINTTGAVSNNVREVFKFVNQNSILRIMIKDIIRTLGDCDFKKIRKLIDEKVSDILTQYRACLLYTSRCV